MKVTCSLYESQPVIASRRTQAERTAATRSALIDAGRRLFGEHGFAEVGTQMLVDAAGVTRGALYHQFGDKRGLFEAVFDDTEKQVIGSIGERVADLAVTDPIGALRAAISVALEVFTEPDVQRIALIDSPVVLGWQHWRGRGETYGFTLIEGLLAAAVERGQIAEQPLHPVAHVALGALDEAALYVAGADDRERAGAEMLVVLNRVVDAFTLPTPPT